MKQEHKISLVILVLLAACFSPLMTLAHVTGASWEKVVDGYKIDVGYDPVNFVAGESARLDFNIFKTSGDPADFSDVWVRISQGDATVFASGIHRFSFGLTTMTYTFPKEGNYNINVRFEKDDNTIVQTVLPVTVAQGETGSGKSSAVFFTWPVVCGFIGGLAVGSGVILAVRRKKA